MYTVCAEKLELKTTITPQYVAEVANRSCRLALVIAYTAAKPEGEDDEYPNCLRRGSSLADVAQLIESHHR